MVYKVMAINFCIYTKFKSLNAINVSKKINCQNFNFTIVHALWSLHRIYTICFNFCSLLLAAAKHHFRPVTSQSDCMHLLHGFERFDFISDIPLLQLLCNYSDPFHRVLFYDLPIYKGRFTHSNTISRNFLSFSNCHWQQQLYASPLSNFS